MGYLPYHSPVFATQPIRFVRAVVDTVDLYHDRQINPVAALTVLRGLSKKYQEPLEIVGLRRKDQTVILKVKVSEWTDQAKLKDEYYTEYEQEVNLNFQAENFRSFMQDPEFLRQLTVLRKRVASLEQHPTNHIEYFYNERGIVMIGGRDLNLDQSRNINIDGDVEGSVLNLGEISGYVSAIVNQLPDEPVSTEKFTIKELLTQLQKAIEDETELSPEDKADLLEQVAVLAEAKQTPDKAKQEGLVRKARKMFDATLRSLPDTAQIADACSKLFPMILRALGLSV